MIKISTGLVDAMMNNVGATSALNAAELELRIFSGPEPLTADAALANETLLVPQHGPRVHRPRGCWPSGHCVWPGSQWSRGQHGQPH